MTHLGKPRFHFALVFFAIAVGSSATIEPALGATIAGASVDTDARKPDSTFRDCNDNCPEMLVIDAGSVQMGTAEGEDAGENATILQRRASFPRHRVSIHHKFALGKFDVTRGEYAAFVRETGYSTGNDCTGYATDNRFRHSLSGLNWRNPGFAQTDRDPVVCLNWDDAHAYLTWLSRKTHRLYRLPSESEWEYAARAGTSTSRFWGDQLAGACRYANVRDLSYLSAKKMPQELGFYFGCSDGFVYTSPVGSFLGNGFGLYDMLGNTRQLTEDCWNWSYLGAPADGSAWVSGDCLSRVTRGGSFDDPPKFVSSSFRSKLPIFLRSDTTSFRAATTLEMR